MSYFTLTPNGIFDQMRNISGAEFKLLMAINRLTEGWIQSKNKKNTEPIKPYLVQITLSKLTQLTGLSRQTVYKAIKTTKEKGILIFRECGPVKLFGINKASVDQMVDLESGFHEKPHFVDQDSDVKKLDSPSKVADSTVKKLDSECQKTRQLSVKKLDSLSLESAFPKGKNSALNILNVGNVLKNKQKDSAANAANMSFLNALKKEDDPIFDERKDQVDNVLLTELDGLDDLLEGENATENQKIPPPPPAKKHKERPWERYLKPKKDKKPEVKKEQPELSNKLFSFDDSVKKENKKRRITSKKAKITPEISQKFMVIWNENRGELASITSISEKRAKRLQIIIDEFGLEEALERFEQASKYVAQGGSYKEKGWGFGNLITGDKVEKHSDSWRSLNQHQRIHSVEKRFNLGDIVMYCGERNEVIDIEGNMHTLALCKDKDITCHISRTSDVFLSLKKVEAAHETKRA